MHRYTRMIHFLITPDMEDHLIAISFFTGHKGAKSWAAKIMLQEAITRYVAGLSPKDRKVFDEILGNIKVTSPMKPDHRLPPSKYVKKKLRGGI